MKRLLPAVVWGAAVWGVVGTAAALQVISGPHVIASALFLIPRIGPIGVALGVCHGLWVGIERDRSPWARHPAWTGGITGGTVGLLGFLPACAINGVPTLSRAEVTVYLAAAVVGGFCAGAVLGYLMRGQDKRAGAPSTVSRLVVPVSIWVVTACAELASIGPEVTSRLLPARLSITDVHGIALGSARGTARSGYYSLMAMNVDSTGGWDCLATIAQHDGTLSVVCEGNHSYRGGIDSSGRFRVGAATQSPGSNGATLQELEMLTGRFVDDTTINIELYTQVSPGFRSDMTRMLWRGRGRRCASSDAGSCPDRTNRPR